MLQKIIIILVFLNSFLVSAQNEQLALQYFDDGEFEKALTIFEESSQKQPSNFFFFQKIIECQQQLKQYEKVEELISKRKDKNNQPLLLIELGYNYQLQKNTDKAEKNYELAIQEVDKEPNYAYQVANSFEKKVLLEWALKAYETAQKKNPKLNFDYQSALLHGQLGKLDLMLQKLLDYSYSNQENTALVQNQLSRFLLDDVDGAFANEIKKGLLLKTQKSQDVYWNQFLSWYFVQQKEYGKAFVQEKAVYKRNPDSFYNIVTLAKLAIDEKQNEDATSILTFVLENTENLDLQMQAHHFLVSMEIESALEKDYLALDLKLQGVLKKYGVTPFSLELQILTAHFEAFYLKQTDSGKQLLQNALQLPLNIREESRVKMELANILVYDEKFNQAILYYAQVEENLKNDVLAHEASFKLAKANFYKRDFDWTLQQVKNLKQSPSLLIANDAVELFLLIEDNSVEDSLRIALQDYAKAEFQLYQKKNDEALQSFLTILQKHKGKSIEESTLFKVGKIYEEKNDYAKAIQYYQNILEQHKDGIYKDEALFFSAEIYRKHLLDIEKAKQLYEKIVLEHPDSLYFTESRKQYRTLRGDSTI
ncbi:tetratricopeptide repeat protein [Flavobacterium sp.]|uniref:tetratricopeptide repeat protein n=1 Tax=Flavobacterium sp. TaxID=239 RepID=UPI0037C04D4F